MADHYVQIGRYTAYRTTNKHIRVIDFNVDSKNPKGTYSKNSTRVSTSFEFEKGNPIGLQ